jgi:hypothetical protein
VAARPARPRVGERTLAERLLQARRKRFVGRGGEVELFRSALDAPDDAFSVLFIHGPGGVGKTSLFRELSDVARQADARPISVDAHGLPPSPAAFQAALSDATHESAGDACREALPRTERHVIFIDSFELLAPLEEWMREQFLPGLPADTLVVIAGRSPPSPRWVADPGWRDLLRVISLRNLPPEDTRSYLRIEGVLESAHDQVLMLTHGHPLTLSLLVDAVSRNAGGQDPVPRALSEAPDLVRALLGHMVDAAPSTRHLTALHLCAHARLTTENLLRAVLGGDDVPDLFGWLRRLSFVEEGPDGLLPHDVARDVLDADLRWRDPVGYSDLHRRIRSHLIARARNANVNAREKQRLLSDVIFLMRGHPIAGGYWNWSALGRMQADALRPMDVDLLLELTQQHQGEEQADLAAHWMARQPQSFRVFRDHADAVIGYAAYLALHQASDDDLAVDPGAGAMWAYAERHGPPRPDEQVMAWRFLVERDPQAGPQASGTLLGLWHAQEILARANCAWDFIGTYTDLDHWSPFFAFYDFHHAAAAGYVVGDRPYVVFAHDWRRVGVEEWLDLTGARELGAPVTEPSEPSTDVALSQPEFAAAVKHALRYLHRPDQLAANPLLRSRLVRDQQRETEDSSLGIVELLRDLITSAAETVRADRRDEPMYRVLDRTFLRPAATQEKAAELLDLPFSTYRRHRNRGVERVTAWLWRRELYGAAHDDMASDEIGHQVDTSWPGT